MTVYVTCVTLSVILCNFFFIQDHQFITWNAIVVHGIYNISTYIAKKEMRNEEREKEKNKRLDNTILL